jgi:hypothetical protein
VAAYPCPCCGAPDVRGAARLVRHLPGLLLGGRRGPTPLADLHRRRQRPRPDRVPTHVCRVGRDGTPVHWTRTRGIDRRNTRAQLAAHRPRQGLLRRMCRPRVCVAKRLHRPVLVATRLLEIEVSEPADRGLVDLGLLERLRRAQIDQPISDRDRQSRYSAGRRDPGPSRLTFAGSGRRAIVPPRRCPRPGSGSCPRRIRSGP